LRTYKQGQYPDDLRREILLVFFIPSPNPLSFYSNIDIVENFGNFTSVTIQVKVFLVLTQGSVMVGYQRFGQELYTPSQHRRQLETDALGTLLFDLTD